MKRLLLLIAATLPCCYALGEPTPALVQTLAEPVRVRHPIPLPPPRQEVMTPAPGPGQVWIAGSWNRLPEGWQWQPGGWVTPPARNAYWALGYWQVDRKGKSHVWIPPRWELATHGLIVPTAPAIPLAFPDWQTEKPRSKVPIVWQPGHWEWRGAWHYEPGLYIESLYPGATWFPGEWVANGDGNVRWTPAHWRTPPRRR